MSEVQTPEVIYPFEKAPFLPAVKIQLDRERHVCYPITSLFAFQEETGIDLINGDSQAEDRMAVRPTMQGFKDLAALMRAGLLYEDPKIKSEDLLGMLTVANLIEYHAACSIALGAALGLKEGEDENPTPPGTARPAGETAATAGERAAPEENLPQSISGQ